jgi:pyrroloquinoline quinone biosynthesis protein D
VKSVVDDRSVLALRPGHRLQWEPSQGAHVLLYPEGMVKLNPSAAAILEQLDGERDVAAVVAVLEERYRQAGLGDDVRELLGEAVRRGWVHGVRT